MKVRYKGEVPADLPGLGIHVEPGDVIDMPKGFEHPQFEPVSDAPKKDGEK